MAEQEPHKSDDVSNTESSYEPTTEPATNESPSNS